MFVPAEYIFENCPSCHPTEDVKTLAKFTDEYEEIKKEYTYACIKCKAKIWANEQWIKDHVVEVGKVPNEINTEGNKDMSTSIDKEYLVEIVQDFDNNSAELSSGLEMLEALNIEVGRFQEDITNWEHQKIPSSVIVRETRNKMLLISELFFHLNNRFQKTGLELDQTLTAFHTLLSNKKEGKPV